MDVLSKVRDELVSGAAQIDVRGRAPEMVHAASALRRRRGRRNSAGIALVTAVVVAVASVALVTRTSNHPARHGSVSIAVSTTVRPKPKGPPAPAPALRFSWKPATGLPPFEGAQYFTTTSGATYAMQQVLPPTPGQWFWWTTDGNWQLRHIDFGRRLLAFTGYGDTLYALLAPPNNGTGSYLLASSSNGGASWNRSALPVAFGPPSTKVAWSIASGTAQLAVNGQGLMVVGDAWFQAQPVTAALQSYRSASNTVAYATQIGDAGVDITRCYVPNPRDTCTPTVIRRFSWPDLGLSSQRAIFEQGVWFSRDATHWSRVEKGLDTNAEWGDALDLPPLRALRDRFVMSVHPYRNPTVLSDYTPTYYELIGGAWREAPFGHAGRVGFGDATTDMVMMLVHTPRSAGPCVTGFCAIQTSTDAGATWHTTLLRDLVPQPTEARLFYGFTRPIGGGVGFTAALGIGRKCGPDSVCAVDDALIASRDGVRWTVVSPATAGVNRWHNTQPHAGAGRLFVSFRDSRHGFATSAVVGTVTNSKT